jgi:hypothetical protein
LRRSTSSACPTVRRPACSGSVTGRCRAASHAPARACQGAASHRSAGLTERGTSTTPAPSEHVRPCCPPRASGHLRKRPADVASTLSNRCTIERPGSCASRACTHPTRPRHGEARRSACRARVRAARRDGRSDQRVRRIPVVRAGRLDRRGGETAAADGPPRVPDELVARRAHRPASGACDDRLVRAQRGLHSLTWPDDEGVEFHLPHGEWIALLRRHGLTVRACMSSTRPRAPALPGWLGDRRMGAALAGRADLDRGQGVKPC